MKKITRRQARAWHLPMRKCLRQIRATGYADSIRGYAVTRLHASDDYARIDYCAAGFRALPFPLPDVHRDVLKGLPRDEIDVYIESLRKKRGVNFSRPEYTYADGLRALQRNGLDAS